MAVIGVLRHENLDNLLRKLFFSELWQSSASAIVHPLRSLTRNVLPADHPSQDNQNIFLKAYSELLELFGQHAK